MTTNYRDIYSKYFGIIKAEQEIIEWLGELNDKQREHFNARKAEEKHNIRRRLRDLPGDPLTKSLLDGGKRACDDGDIGYYEWWYESDDETMTDEEVAEYVDNEYRWHAEYPGSTYTEVSWARTLYGLRIIIHTSMDI